MILHRRPLRRGREVSVECWGESWQVVVMDLRASEVEAIDEHETLEDAMKDYRGRK